MSRSCSRYLVIIRKGITYHLLACSRQVIELSWAISKRLFWLPVRESSKDDLPERGACFTTTCFTHKLHVALRKIFLKNYSICYVARLSLLFTFVCHEINKILRQVNLTIVILFKLYHYCIVTTQSTLSIHALTFF